MMFENLKDKIINVQHDLTSSLRNLTVGDPKNFKTHVRGKKGASLNAGADLLHYYKSQWEELHRTSEENAEAAEDVAYRISDLNKFCRQEQDLMKQFNYQLSLAPGLHSSVMNLMGRIGELQGLFEEVESSLLNLENVLETQALQEKQLDHRFQLALYKEKKLAAFEELKVKLAQEHSKKVQEFEMRQQKVLKERQEAFREAFEEEMQHYKIHGRVERLSSTGSAGHPFGLEDVELENNEVDQSALDAFLAEELSPGSKDELDTDKDELDTVKDDLDKRNKDHDNQTVTR
ncbi:dysbindin-like isoform X2 [Limulus polyphemus]|uniref:Dysbindin-like isoform X2 n=1 Tax=Limulus polyphemus TaxID=6850 RepID=A0ABM1SXV9_LIMPO|nr:dysbindin-like isoform X2 [Limulus polyphemus]